jgi:hypothetical protein
MAQPGSDANTMPVAYTMCNCTTTAHICTPLLTESCSQLTTQLIRHLLLNQQLQPHNQVVLPHRPAEQQLALQDVARSEKVLSRAASTRPATTTFAECLVSKKKPHAHHRVYPAAYSEVASLKLTTRLTLADRSAG